MQGHLYAETLELHRAHFIFLYDCITRKKYCFLCIPLESLSLIHVERRKKISMVRMYEIELECDALFV